MMKQSRNNKLLGSLFTPILILACVVSSAKTPLATQVLQPLDSQSLETIIAQTISAAQTSTVFHLPSLTSTRTSTPTTISTFTPEPTITNEFSTFGPTYTVGVPTLTQVISTSPPVVSASPPQEFGQVVSSPAGTLSESDQRATNFPKIPREWNCRITEKNPPKGTLIKKKSEFYVTWTIVNEGTKTWTANTIDFVYTGGFRHEGKPIQDFPSTVAPGRSVTLKVLINAPKASGTYNVYWSLKVGNTLFCHMKNTFEVN